MLTNRTAPSLAFERHGAGVPIVLLPGMTFERRTWRPIVERLGDDVCSIAVDLPAQGESAGPSCDLVEVAARVHELVESLGVDEPVVVGHSMSGGAAMIYASRYPARGVVTVDPAANLVPFAELVQRLQPALRGPDFARSFEPFQQSMGLDRIPEPLRSEVLAAQEVRQDTVLGYWDETMRSEPLDLQRGVEQVAAAIDIPFLAVFGRQLPREERDYLRRLVPGTQLEEWPDRGHFVHLAAADRFAARLRAFVDFCETRRREEPDSPSVLNLR
jgi:pimeloyl-ACP methyl ester carboxylesterase